MILEVWRCSSERVRRVSGHVIGNITESRDGYRQVSGLAVGGSFKPVCVSACGLYVGCSYDSLDSAMWPCTVKRCTCGGLKLGLFSTKATYVVL